LEIFPDEIIEPGEQVYLTNFKIENKGDMVIPEGAIIEMSCSHLLNTDRAAITQRLETSYTDILTTRLNSQVCIFSEPTKPSDTPFSLETVVSFQLSVYGRLLKYKYSRKFLIQYPLSITKFSTPRQLSNGETSTFLYTIANISSIKYGTGIGYPTCELYYSKYIGKSFETRNQGNFQLTLPLDEVTANGTLSDLKQTVCVGDDAPLFEMCDTLLTLYYKGRPIHMVDRVIRVTH
jgi:hypothetical protein